VLVDLQNSVGRFQDAPVMMWNPPFTLALIIPFGLMDHAPGRMVWLFLHLTIDITCSSYIWQHFGVVKRESGQPGF
jgi:hypothetical protein